MQKQLNGENKGLSRNEDVLIKVAITEYFFFPLIFFQLTQIHLNIVLPFLSTICFLFKTKELNENNLCKLRLV